MGLRQSAQVELSSRQTSGGRPKLRLKIKPLRSRCPSPPPESAKIEAAATSPSSQGHSKTSSWGCYPPHRVHSPFKGELPQGLDPGWQLPAEHDWPACAQPDSSDSLHSTLECRLEAAQPASMQQGVESTHMGVPALPAVSIRPRQPRQFVPYEIVWAKLASHPWWPAQVQLPTDQHLHLKHRPGDVFVVFYGDCNFAWVPRSGLAPFAADYSLRSKAGNKKLQGAVDAAWAALGRPRPLPESATGTIMLPEHLLSGQPALPHLPP
ncbi:hypothetical protein WJX72_010286 [[Myrmecia] bisecta]|uniref:PWWP domain-containing protein n=1 Tax=[Myrmecia] bisecta TaxID=41462 RepID=A0AAW1PLV1_9CHLO